MVEPIHKCCIPGWPMIILQLQVYYMLILYLKLVLHSRVANDHSPASSILYADTVFKAFKFEVT